MINIKLDAYERNDLLLFLRYSREKSREDYRTGKITHQMLTINLDKIKTLEKRLNGITEEDYIRQKDTGGFIY